MQPTSFQFRRLPVMLLVLSAAALVACGSGHTPQSKAACAVVSDPDPALEVPLDQYGLDQWLFDAAVRHAVNVQRCRRGLVPLAEDPALARAAAMHSGDMVRRDFFDHTSPVEGRATPAERFSLTGTQFTLLAENIATLSLYDFRGHHFIQRDPANCDFSFTRNGPSIPARSYAGAAEALVERWMDSAGHRRNILHPRLTRHGAGAAIRPDPAICGELVVVQDFAG